MTNAIKVLLQMQSGFLQLASTLLVFTNRFLKIKIRWALFGSGIVFRGKIRVLLAHLIQK
jgi:hypothetical protein